MPAARHSLVHFGERAPTLNSLGQSTYEGVHFLASLFERGMAAPAHWPNVGKEPIAYRSAREGAYAGDGMNLAPVSLAVDWTSNTSSSDFTTAAVAVEVSFSVGSIFCSSASVAPAKLPPCSIAKLFSATSSVPTCVFAAAAILAFLLAPSGSFGATWRWRRQ